MAEVLGPHVENVNKVQTVLGVMEWTDKRRTWYHENVRRYDKIGSWLAAAGTGVVLAVTCCGCASGTSRDSATHAQADNYSATNAVISRDPATHAQANNYSATNAYLRAREAFIRSSRAELPAGRGTMAAFVAHIHVECAGALRGTPVGQVTPPATGTSAGVEDAQVEDARFIVEIEQGLEAAEREPQTAAVRRFAETVASIQWSDPRITDLVHTLMQIELQRVDSRPLDVCREIREWARSGYQKLPAPTSAAEPRGAAGRKWIRDMAALGCGKFSPATPREVLRALRPYGQPGDRPTTRDVEVMEIQLALEESHARVAAPSLPEALGIEVSRHKPSKHQRRITALSAPPEPPGCSGKPDLISEQVREPTGRRTTH